MRAIDLDLVPDLSTHAFLIQAAAKAIKDVKRCLKKIIGKAKFTQDELLTAITEVEMVINS